MDRYSWLLFWALGFVGGFFFGRGYQFRRVCQYLKKVGDDREREINEMGRIRAENRERAAGYDEMLKKVRAMTGLSNLRN
jgi:hypothetical protein